MRGVIPFSRVIGIAADADNLDISRGLSIPGSLQTAFLEGWHT